MIKLNKSQLDNASTAIGLILAILIPLNTYDYLPKRETSCVIAILIAVGGYLTNKPATARPTTEEVEDKAISSDRRDKC